jgi:flavodoxin
VKTLIVYSSETGNTKKLAEALHELLGENTLCHINEAPDPSGYDLVALGFWLQAGKPDSRSAAYLTKIGHTKLFLFSTHGAAADSAHALKAMEHAESLASSAQLVGAFNCQGEVNPAIMKKAAQKDPQPPWIGDAADAVGHPDQSDIDQLTEVVKTKLSEFFAEHTSG